MYTLCALQFAWNFVSFVVYVCGAVLDPLDVDGVVNQAFWAFDSLPNAIVIVNVGPILRIVHELFE